MSLILGIETSCDDTGVALYDSRYGLLANTIYSQTIHNKYGGVVPELASRDHIKKIIPLITECLLIAKTSLTAVDAIAFTVGPGLNGSLLVGSSVANAIAFALNKPVIPIHHLEGHILSPFLSNIKPQFPFIALLVSGGHSQLIAVRTIGNYEIIGDTLDDAAGEAFDKTAKMLGLEYPGGKHIAALAKLANKDYNLPRPMINSNDLNMSFSGLKTATLHLINKLGGLANLTNQDKADIARSVENAITDVLLYKTKLALTNTQITNLVVSGGVSANLTLRDKLNTTLKNSCHGITVYYPSLEFCTDNGAMIALVGSLKYQQELTYNYSFTVKPRFAL